MAKEKTLQQQANLIARTIGHSRATAIIYGGSDQVVQSTRPGYRKYTTGEYVPNSYRWNFGWKNTYYQHAVCIVAMRIF